MARVSAGIRLRFSKLRHDFGTGLAARVHVITA
jgi:hypothetical protein